MPQNPMGFGVVKPKCHQRPGGILPAVGGSFWLVDPQNPVGLGASTPSPAGDFVFFYLKFLGIQLPNLLTGLGDQLPKVGFWGVWESTLQLLGVN
jgi:hypothetical protein